MVAGATGISTLLYLTRDAAEINAPKESVATVDVAEVVKQDVRIEIQAQGTVSPVQETTLLAQVQGAIIGTAKEFHAGGFVAKDSVLLQIDPRDYESRMLRAQANLESAESALVQEKGRAQVALREWEKLPKNSQRSEEARDLYLRKPQLEEAQANLLAAQADLDTAKNDLERTVIRAPYDALIKAKHTDLGQFVGTGSPLVELFSVEMAEVRLPIPQSRLEYLELPGLEGYENGSAIDLYTAVGGKVKHWPAQLHRTEGVFDERSRALYTVARIEDPYGLRNKDKLPLRIGTFVNANIAGREIKNVVVLPRYILRAGNFVWVVDDTNHLRNRKVTTLRTGGDQIYVSAGLADGELVSLTNLDASFAGVKTDIISQTPSDQLFDPEGQPQEAPSERIGNGTAAAQQNGDTAGGE
ncbi:MAG: efflux RND transporter periplasmic adaptor subunit [Pseudomonadota bacterium]